MEMGQIPHQTFEPSKQIVNYEDQNMIIGVGNKYDNPLDLIHMPEYGNGQSLAGDSETQNGYEEAHLNNRFSTINKIESNGEFFPQNDYVNVHKSGGLSASTQPKSQQPMVPLDQLI